MEKSRVEWILRYGLGEVSTLPPRLSRIEKLLVELIQQGSGGDITVDDELSPTSENPVQNKVLNSIINGTGSGSVYSKIMLAIAEVVAEAPEDFDTLKEISDWISHHEDSAAAMNSAIQANTTAIAGKVDKVSGKGLSTNDYTTEEKTKLASISANASDVGQLYPDSTHGEIFNNYKNNVASGDYSHAEGIGTTASGPASHAEGNSTTASSADAHAEGGNTTSSGIASHAEGYTTIASGRYSHTEGMETMATGECSHSEGLATWACGGQHVQGRYNKHDTSCKYSFIIGNGTDDSHRSDAFAVGWNGLIYQNNSETGVDLNNKVDKVSGKGLSTNDYTTEEKTKLSGIEEGATKTIVDTNLSSTSTNPIQNKAVQAQTARLVDAVSKNLLNLLTPTKINRTTIVDVGGGSVTASCSDATWANSSYELSLKDGKIYKLIIYVDSASTSNVLFQCFAVDISDDTPQELARTSRITSSGVYSVDFVATSKIRVGININNSSTAATGSATYHAMLCTAEDYAVSQEFVPYTPTMREMYENKSDISAVGLRLVASDILQFNTSYTYQMNKNDFDKNEVGTYIVSTMTWSTTPKYSLYAISYTENSLSYTSIVKIAGDDMTVTVEDGVISVSGLPSSGGKISIHALQ